LRITNRSSPGRRKAAPLSSTVICQSQMKLIYKTDDIARANLILAVLLRAGIKGSIQGKNSSGINNPAFREVLSVWVHNNDDYAKALNTLEAFYYSVIDTDDDSYVKPDRKSHRVFWFLFALTLGVLVAYYIWHITNHLS